MANWKKKVIKIEAPSTDLRQKAELATTTITVSHHFSKKEVKSEGFLEIISYYLSLNYGEIVCSNALFQSARSRKEIGQVWKYIIS